MSKPNQPDPLDFFGHLKWIDGRPLPDVIEPYRAQIFREVLFTFDGDGRPRYSLALTGRAKKNWKSADLVLASLYRFLAWRSPQGSDCFILANDEGQAGDDLKLAKLLIRANPVLAREVEVQTKELVRTDGAGSLKILPARDVAGSHGKTYSMVAFDEIHAYRNWDLFEALAPDPTRHDALTWVTSYASIYNSPGFPLYDMLAAARKGEDARMFFSWYSGDDSTTDPEFASLEPEERANPSMVSWDNPGYLAQQRLRLPTHRFRRLHLNLPGAPDGAFLDAGAVLECIVEGRRQLPPEDGRKYVGFVDMSGGSSDDAVLAIAHQDPGSKRGVLDLLVKQDGRTPFNPRAAVKKFAGILKQYGLSRVTGDAYAGQTFRADFAEHKIEYAVCKPSKSDLYEALEPAINAGRVELLDQAILQE